jgi:hypothetical protein
MHLGAIFLSFLETYVRIRVLLVLLRAHFEWVTPKLGGYGHIYGYWSPDKTIVIQEDVLGICSPGIYRDLFRALNAHIVKALGECVLFHLHSTGFRHYRDVLSIKGLAGLELTVEANGPSLRDLAPTLAEILEQTRLILYVDSGFEDLPWLLRKLPQEGLYLLIPDRFIASDQQFREFTKVFRGGMACSPVSHTKAVSNTARWRN